MGKPITFLTTAQRHRPWNDGADNELSWDGIPLHSKRLCAETILPYILKGDDVLQYEIQVFE
jgi:hypothetical protein